MRLGDLDALLEKVQFRIPCDSEVAAIVNECVKITKHLIENAPTIDAVPVRHGRWVRNDLGETYCSECHSRIPYVQCYDFYPDCCMDDEDTQWDEEIERTNYCPNCGAKMNGGTEDDHQGT